MVAPNGSPAITDRALDKEVPDAAAKVVGPKTASGVRYYSDTALIQEHRGLRHWALYTDGTSIFAWDVVLNTPVRRVLTDLKKASAIAVDANRGYLFVVE